MRITVNVRGGAQLRAALAQYGARAELALGAAMYQEAERVMAKSKSLASVGVTGHGRASGYVKPPRRRDRALVVEMGYGGDAEYMLYQHEGTGPAVGRPPFMPPSAAFRDWARKFLGDEDLAFVVARAVGRRGLRPKKFLERPLREAANGMAGRVAQRVRAITGA